MGRRRVASSSAGSTSMVMRSSGHRLVTGQPREIGPEREQQRVHAQLPHPVAHSRQALPRASTGSRAGTLAAWSSPCSRRGFCDRAPGVIARAGEREASTWLNPIALAAAPISSNSAGRPPAHHREWRWLGRRYCPIVTMSTPTARRSERVARTSDRVSPMPREAGLRHQPGPLRTAEDREAPGVRGRGPDGALQAEDGLDVVVEDVRPGIEDRPEEAGSPLQSGISTSTVVPGTRERMAAIVRANAAAPPSARSSRAPPSRRHGRGPSGRRHRRRARARSPRAAGGGECPQDRNRTPSCTAPIDHERRRAVRPALGEVRAAGLLAHGDEPRPRIIERSRSTSGPILTGARTKSGLRSRKADPRGRVDARRRGAVAPRQSALGRGDRLR